MIFKIIGALGLICISTGVLLRRRKVQDILYIIGGLLLLVYSFYIQDFVFITLQIVFIISAIIALVKLKGSRNA